MGAASHPPRPCLAHRLRHVTRVPARPRRRSSRDTGRDHVVGARWRRQRLRLSGGGGGGGGGGGDPGAGPRGRLRRTRPPPGGGERLSECLRRIGDELDSNMELQRMIEQVGCVAPKKLFFRVAKEMFADGTFNWGRVVALFYFACKLALCTKVPELVQTILRWTMEYLQEHVLAWIQGRGGWEGLLSHFGTPTWQTITIFAAGVLTASLTIWKMS
ncbi:LOW QUALITY PROTEIN: apoptosis regulator BAX-like [Hirundo rustica]|uniref:LOW QUALITY PROTEIN: apoptosis regulator BAX-like n=1 Tax=Hirundo rustica TaxID=43150 RepID=UPI0026713ED1|nr:LOW QUALITY PROTEIN: apoptosis regulator BAX-like [Hirundo rustica]